MKGCLIHILVIFCTTLHAQTIEFSVLKSDANCRGANNGQAKVIVVAANPPYSYAWSNGSTSSVISGLAPGDYSCTITDGSGSDTTVSVNIGEIPCPINPELIFTPNGDGYNDTWTINSSSHYTDLTVLVYNRWGQKVFESKGAYTPWDGTDAAGRSLPDNSYYYIIYSDQNDEASIVKGCVSILR